MIWFHLAILSGLVAFVLVQGAVAEHTLGQTIKSLCMDCQRTFLENEKGSEEAVDREFSWHIPARSYLHAIGLLFFLMWLIPPQNRDTVITEEESKPEMATSQSNDALQVGLGGFVIGVALAHLMVASNRRNEQKNPKAKTSPDAAKYIAEYDLRQIYEEFTNIWPDHNDEYPGYKPDTLLPATKQTIKDALKYGYQNWPRDLRWTEFYAFSIEFAEIGMYLSPIEFELIHRFQTTPYQALGKAQTRNPLTIVRPHTNFASMRTEEDAETGLEYAQEFLTRSFEYESDTFSEEEISEIRRIVVKSHVDVHALSYEWKLFIKSIGRDSYLPDEDDSDSDQIPFEPAIEP